jgi:hypothetical protein
LVDGFDVQAAMLIAASAAMSRRVSVAAGRVSTVSPSVLA